MTLLIAITYLLPGLVPDGENNTVNPVAQAWFAAGLTQPLLFHALVFAGSIHLDFMRSSTIHPNSPVALSHKLAVIQKLNMILSNPKEAQKDEVILAILILASHEARCDSESKIQPFQSPLKSAQWLNVYGNIQYVPQHMTAVMELLTLRGGIETLKLHGLAETIVWSAFPVPIPSNEALQVCTRLLTYLQWRHYSSNKHLVETCPSTSTESRDMD